MGFEDRDRRRVWLLLVVTLMAVGGWWVVSRVTGDETTTGDTTGDTTAGGDGGVPATEAGSQLPPLPPAGEALPVFLGGPVAPPVAGVPEIAVPPVPAEPPVQATATFRTGVAGPNTCIVAGFTTGRTVTIVNLDNGLSITCVTSTAASTQREDVVMTRSLFSRLADLTDAPIPVEIRP